MSNKSLETRTYIPGTEILWREESSARKWHTGFVVGRDNQWVLVKNASGLEISVHPSNVKPKK